MSSQDERENYVKETYKKSPSITSNANVPTFKDRDTIECAMKDDISIHLRLTTKNIKEARFFIMAFNFFIITDPEKLHMPAEVSLCAYSIKEGLVKVYSRHLNPETDLFGSYYLAMDHSQHTHMLPISPNAKGTSDLKGVYIEIINFLRNFGDETAKNGIALPPVYTYTDQICIVKSCLAYFMSFFPDLPELTVYSIQYLGEEIISRSKNLGKDDCSKIDISEKEFERDKFEYEIEMACKYHENEDRVKYCTQHRVIRWSYTLSDFLSTLFNIELTHTSHLPPKYKVIKRESFAKNTKRIKSISGGDDMVNTEKLAVFQNDTDDDLNEENPNNTNSDCNEVQRKEIESSSRYSTQGLDFLKIINACRSQNRFGDNQMKQRVVSNVLISHWNTKQPGASFMGYGRGYP